MKRPAFQFYPADWRKDAALQSCSIGARGLWVEMLCIMHECVPYGHLCVNGNAMNPSQLSRLVGESVKAVDGYLAELELAGVFSKDDQGRIYSRRMVKDEQLREIRAAAGAKGGNPDLIGGYNYPGFVYVMRRSKDGAVKIGVSVDPSKRLYKIRRQFQGQQIDLISKYFVDDMGACESECHSKFSEFCLDGEWFGLGEEGLSSLDVHLKAKSKATTTPSSSSSSSSSTTVLKADARATRLPADWVLPEELKQWARAEMGWQESVVETVAASFKDYWIAKPGKDGRKLDWPATWRNWCRNQRLATAGKASKARPWFLDNWSAVVAKGAEFDLRECDFETPPEFRAAVFKAAGITKEIYQKAEADYR